MTEMTPRVRQLLRRANRVAESGKRMGAEKLFRDLATEAPNVPDVWLGLAGVVADKEEKIALYQRVLTLDPDNEQAQAGARGETWMEPEPPQLPVPVAIPEPAPVVQQPLPTEQEHVHDFTEFEESAAQPEETFSAEIGGLRCNRCGKPINATNSKHTEVGYRCNNCIRELEDEKYFSATTINYILAVIVAFAASLGAVFLISMIGFWFIAIFASPAAGTAIGRFAFQAAGRNRGRYLPELVGGAVAFAGAIMLILTYNFFVGGIFIVFATSAAYYQVRG